MAMSALMTSDAAITGAASVRRKRIGTRIAAEIMRFFISLCPSEPAAAPVKFLNGAVQVFRSKVRPKYIHNHIFRVRGLPQQEIADPHLSGRPDDQFRIGYARRVQIPGENVLGQVFRVGLSGGDIRRVSLHRVDDLIPPAVVQAEIYLDVVFLRAAFRVVAEGLQLRTETGQVAEKAEFYPVLFKIMKENYQRLQEEVTWFTDKFDYRNKDKDWGNSKDSIQRCMQKLGGGYPADEPFTEGL